MNRVCSIHNEYCPDGNCRWCEAPAAASGYQGINRSTFLFWKTSLPTVVSAERTQEIVNRPWATLMRQENERIYGDSNDGHGAFE